MDGFDFRDRIAERGLIDAFCTGDLGWPAVACFGYLQQGRSGACVHVASLASGRSDPQGARWSVVDGRLHYGRWTFCLSPENDLYNWTIHCSSDRDRIGQELARQETSLDFFFGGIQMLLSKRARCSGDLKDDTFGFRTRHGVGHQSSQLNRLQHSTVASFAAFLDPFGAFDGQESSDLVPFVLEPAAKFY